MNKRTHVKVADDTVIRFIEQVELAGGTNITVSQGDKDLYVTYMSPFTRDIKEDGALVIKEAEPDRPDTAGPLCCQSCIKIKACKQTYVETGTWPVPRDCFVPSRVKKYPQFEMDSCEECNVIHSCIARYDMNRANWRCAKGKVHLNFTELHDAPCSPQMIAEADCDGDKAKCGDACHAKSKQKND